MRVIVLLCLLVPFSEAMFNPWLGPTTQPTPSSEKTTVFRSRWNSWNGPNSATPQPEPELDVCLTDQTSCGCCLMKTWIHKIGAFVNATQEEMHQYLNYAKLPLNDLRASRSAFSVALNNNSVMTCMGPFRNNLTVIYKYVFLNLGDGYDVDNGYFTVPRSGMYALAVTYYSDAQIPSLYTSPICLQLLVNNRMEASLPRKSQTDIQDTAAVFIAVSLRAGDRVSVNMLPGCNICDDWKHHNTFTGFLLYPTDLERDM